MIIFLRCVGQAVLAKGMRGFMGMVPVYEVAVDAIARYKQCHREKELAGDIVQLLRTKPEEIQVAVPQIVIEIASNRSPKERVNLEKYLTQIPVVARKLLRRPEDLSGTTLMPDANMQDPEQLAALLPRRMPKFRNGDKVPRAESWVLRSLLGTGSFGEVWLAENKVGKRLAFKFCLDAKASTGLRHLEWELKLVMQASQGLDARRDGIVPLHDAHLEGDLPWLAYEYVAGGDLAGLVHTWSKAPPETRVKNALNILNRLSKIVGQLHRRENPIVHRDLKPANILVRKVDGKIVLHITDFGISGLAVASSIQQSLRETSTMSLPPTLVRCAGAKIYASPQQLSAKPTDVRDDVYALGINGYQMLLGDLSAQRPSGKKWHKTLANLPLPNGLIDLLESCWENDPEDRPKDALVISEAIEGMLRPKVGPVHAEPKAPQAGDVITNSIGMEFVYCTPGNFIMGSPPNQTGRRNDENQADVALTQGFFLGKYVVTQSQWKVVEGTELWKGQQFPKEGNDFPATSINFMEALNFCQALSDEEGKKYRLPTEAEWEYACRAGTTAAYSFGSLVGKLGDYAWFDENADKKGENYAHEVGKKLPNPWGLYDMHGNVWEWCCDWYGDNINGGCDPQGPNSGTVRVIRGGFWCDGPRNCRSARRLNFDPNSRNFAIGFRVALVPSE